MDGGCRSGLPPLMSGDQIRHAPGAMKGHFPPSAPDSDLDFGSAQRGGGVQSHYNLPPSLPPSASPSLASRRIAFASVITKAGPTGRYPDSNILISDVYLYKVIFSKAGLSAGAYC